MCEVARGAVFLSCAWGVGSGGVNRLYESLVDEGFVVECDSNGPRHRASLDGFIKGLSDGGAVVVVLSDAYLRSAYCMRELHAIWRSGKESSQGQERVFAVVHPDVAENSTYEKHWEAEKGALESQTHGTRTRSSYAASFAPNVGEMVAEFLRAPERRLAPHQATDFRALEKAVLGSLAGVEPSLFCERTKASYRHRLRIELDHTPELRPALEVWLDKSFDDATDRPAGALVHEVEQAWVNGDLVDHLDLVPELREALVDQGLGGQDAKRVAEKVLCILMPLHADAPPDSGRLALEVREARRLGRRLLLRYAKDALEAVKAIEIPRGSGLDSVEAYANTFFKEVAQRMPKGTTPKQVQREFRDAKRQYITRRARRLKRGQPVDHLIAPYYLVILDDEPDSEIMSGLSRALEDALYIARDAETDLERIFIRVLRDLRDPAEDSKETEEGTPSGPSSPAATATTAVTSHEKQFDRERLEAWLREAFSESELRELITLRYKHLMPRVNASGSLADFVHDLVGVLERHGELDERFKQHLREARPEKLDEIDALGAEKETSS